MEDRVFKFQPELQSFTAASTRDIASPLWGLIQYPPGYHACILNPSFPPRLGLHTPRPSPAPSLCRVNKLVQSTQNYICMPSYQQYRTGHTNPLPWLFPGCVLTQRNNLPGFPSPRPTPPTPTRYGLLWADSIYHWLWMRNFIMKHSSG